eukprot:Em0004g675a
MSGASTSVTDVVSRILLGLQTMQNELKSVRQGQDEMVRMVRESQIESARISAKGKKPAYTFKKKGNEIQSTFIDKVTEQVASATARMERVKAADESGAVHLARAKEDLEEGIKLLAHRQKMIKFADRSDSGWAVVEEECPKALASVPYPLPNVSEGLMAGESICGRGEGGHGRCWEVQEGDADTFSRTALLEREFVNGAVSELQKGGYIEEAEEPPVVCSPLSVVMNGVGKKRLVVNLRHVNGFLWKQKFKYEDIRVAMAMCLRKNESSEKASSAWVRDTLDRAGWVCNEAKSVWVPTHELVWLGFNLNLSKGSISVPEEKVRALQHSLKVAVKTSSLLAKTVASLIGRIISMSLALGPVARFRTRAYDTGYGGYTVEHEGEGRAPFIVDIRSVPLSEWLVRPGRSGGQLFKGKFPNTAMLAVRIDFVGSSVRYADLNGVFSAGAWPLLGNLEDPELRRLAQSLPATVLRSRSDSTTKKYLGAFQRWKTWAEARQGVPSFPVHELHLVLYMQHLSESTESKAAVEEAVHALSWLHGLAGLQPFSGSPLVKATLEGLRRILAKPKVRKEPVTADMLKAMVEAAGPAPSLKEVRLLAVCLVSYAGFMRCDELLELRGSDVTFNAEGMVVKIESSKTDQYREGASLVIARTRQAKLFRGIVHANSGECLRKDGGLSYTRLRELLLEKLSQLGFDPALFGMHSLRAGGATAAANAGVEERLFKRHGHWKSESAKDGYVKDSLKRRLKVSKGVHNDAKPIQCHGRRR